eukprot:1539257-Rhodomonas_salina.1
MPRQVQPEQLRHGRSKLRRVWCLVHHVRLPVLSKRPSLSKPRHDIAVTQVRPLPSRCHLNAVWGKAPELRVLLIVRFCIVGADVDEEVGKVDVRRAVEAKLVGEVPSHL